MPGIAANSPSSLWGHDAFMVALLARYPELAAQRDPCVEGLLHCEMGWFSHKTDAAIEAGDFRVVRHHFEFIDYALACASEELENAIMVSYLDNVFALNTQNTRRARNLLTPNLSAAVLLMEGHFIAHIDGVRAPIGVNGDLQAVAELERRITKR